MSKVNIQYTELHSDFMDTFRPTQRIRCVDSFQIRGSLDPIKMPIDVKEDPSKNGTQGPILFVLERVEAMTCQVKNWLALSEYFISSEASPKSKGLHFHYAITTVRSGPCGLWDLDYLESSEAAGTLDN